MNEKWMKKANCERPYCLAAAIQPEMSNDVGVPLATVRV